MKILAIADIDDFHWKHGYGKADVLLSCGDVLDEVILEAAKAYACETIFAVKGNHDISLPFAQPIADLHLRTREHGGLRFGGRRHGKQPPRACQDDPRVYRPGRYSCKRRSRSRSARGRAPGRFPRRAQAPS